MTKQISGFVFDGKAMNPVAISALRGEKLSTLVVGTTEVLLPVAAADALSAALAAPKAEPVAEEKKAAAPAAKGPTNGAKKVPAAAAARTVKAAALCGKKGYPNRICTLAAGHAERHHYEDAAAPAAKK